MLHTIILDFLGLQGLFHIAPHPIVSIVSIVVVGVGVGFVGVVQIEVVDFPMQLVGPGEDQRH